MKCIGDATRTIGLTEIQTEIINYMKQSTTHSGFIPDISKATKRHVPNVWRNMQQLCSLGIVEKCIAYKRGTLRGRPSNRYRLTGEVNI